MQKITTFLWFNDNAEQAVKFYTSIFKNSKITQTSYRPLPSPNTPASQSVPSSPLVSN
jgi:predicted 3-demethylubiquinone-9 3-methyltransferase (glyoxalase superfamily)